jgi:hypothetical protein
MEQRQEPTAQERTPGSNADERRYTQIKSTDPRCDETTMTTIR